MIRNNELIIPQRQHLKLCALHSLNNLLQDPSAFSKRDLDEICVKYAWAHYDIANILFE